jgi:hypothetical protein
MLFGAPALGHSVNFIANISFLRAFSAFPCAWLAVIHVTGAKADNHFKSLHKFFHFPYWERGVPIFAPDANARH